MSEMPPDVAQERLGSVRTPEGLSCPVCRTAARGTPDRVLAPMPSQAPPAASSGEPAGADPGREIAASSGPDEAGGRITMKPFSASLVILWLAVGLLAPAPTAAQSESPEARELASLTFASGQFDLLLTQAARVGTLPVKAALEGRLGRRLTEDESRRVSEILLRIFKDMFPQSVYEAHFADLFCPVLLAGGTEGAGCHLPHPAGPENAALPDDHSDGEQCMGPPNDRRPSARIRRAV